MSNLLEDDNIFENCDANNLYVKARNLARNGEEGINKSFEASVITIQMIKERYDVYFKVFVLS